MNGGTFSGGSQYDQIVDASLYPELYQFFKTIPIDGTRFVKRRNDGDAGTGKFLLRAHGLKLFPESHFAEFLDALIDSMLGVLTGKFF